MTRKELYLSTFRGYPEWDDETKAQSMESVISTYAHWLARYSPNDEHYPVEERIDDIRFMIEMDLQDYLEKEEYEICTLFRDTLDIL